MALQGCTNDARINDSLKQEQNVYQSDEKLTTEESTLDAQCVLEDDSDTSVSCKDILELGFIPEYEGASYVTINDNKPDFDEEDYETGVFEAYSELDTLGRCSVAYANIGKEIMPVEERGEIGPVKPSGWHTVKYDFVDGKYLYNRCHLIGYQLSGENANEKNLITGTRYMNVEGMLPFENKVAEYVKNTGNQVLYRVTPVFVDDELVARGIIMEAESVPDKGKTLSFAVYVYNVQPGIEIDYATGESWQADSFSTAMSVQKDAYQGGTESQENENGTAAEGAQPSEMTKSQNSESEQKQTVKMDYILNTNTKKFHYLYCSSVEQMKAHNKKSFSGTRESVLQMGYEPCKICMP